MDRFVACGVNVCERIQKSTPFAQCKDGYKYGYKLVMGAYLHIHVYIYIYIPARPET